MHMKPFILGTRGSALALTQADMAAEALRAAGAEQVERRIIQTTGDLRPDLRLGGSAPGADKAVWTRELEMALRDAEITAAVHSAKDVPAELEAGLMLAAALPRARVNDVLISRHAGGWPALPAGAAVATSSVRRQRQLLMRRPDLRLQEMRGNVPTRLEKLAASSTLDAIVLAQAGLDRLGIRSHPGLHFTPLPVEDFLPAAAQGIVTLEVWGAEEWRDSLLARINHAETWICLLAEREVLRLLGAGCSTPVAVHASVEDGILTVRAEEFDPLKPGAPPRRGAVSEPADQPLKAAAALVSSLAP